MKRNELLIVIYTCIDELNSEMESKSQITKTPETVIFGDESPIDSLGLVNLVVSLEQAINDEFNLELTLADEKAMSEKSSPFRTVSTLADYILKLIENEGLNNG
jgi:acyl carrier protein